MKEERSKDMVKEYVVKGDVCHPGTVQVTDGMTIRQVIEAAGGMLHGKAFKAVQIGGPSGTLLCADQLDLPLDVKALAPFGMRRGDGVVTVLDEDRCIVDAVRRFMEQTQTDFCGKCVSCREGTRRLVELLNALMTGILNDAGFNILFEIGEMVSVTSFCALGKGVYDTLKNAYQFFPEEFEAHRHGRCELCAAHRHLPIEPGNIPYDRRRIVIDPTLCRGCSRCARSCHAEAITGVIKSPFTIDQNKCVKCFTCMELCAFGAIREEEIDG